MVYLLVIRNFDFDMSPSDNGLFRSMQHFFKEHDLNFLLKLKKHVKCFSIPKCRHGRKSWVTIVSTLKNSRCCFCC